jgi:Tetracyclin repressor-like, C-terminal domain
VARRPRLAPLLTDVTRTNYQQDVAFDVEAGLSGGREEVRLLHFAMAGLMLDLLATPDGSWSACSRIGAERSRAGGPRRGLLPTLMTELGKRFRPGGLGAGRADTDGPTPRPERS